MTARRTIMLPCALVAVITATVSCADEPIPVDGAIAEFNRRCAEYPLDEAFHRTPAVPETKRPGPISKVEVFAALRDFGASHEARDFVDPDRRARRDRMLKVIDTIIAEGTMPAGSDFELRVRWYDQDSPESVSLRKWIPMLSVMTSPNTGFAVVVREHVIDKRVAFRPKPGYMWHINPKRPHRGAVNSGGIIRIGEVDAAGNFVVTTARKTDEDVGDLGAVAFDASGNRHSLKRRRVGKQDDVVMERFTLSTNVLALANCEAIGFEAVTRARLPELSKQAIQVAQEMGFNVLPMPTIGAPFQFNLKTIDGEFVSSDSLKGKVVLIDCWASWCGPCVRQFPELKAVYDRWNPKGFEVIGISLDKSIKSANAAIDEHELPWTNAIIGRDDLGWNLWKDASRISSIPRLLLIDADGILRADSAVSKDLHQELDAQLETHR